MAGRIAVRTPRAARSAARPAAGRRRAAFRRRGAMQGENPVTLEHSAPRPSTAERLIEGWLRFVVSNRRMVVVATLAMLVASGFYATRLHKDTTANAYIEPGNPALLYRERVIETFGLKEPVVIAVRSSGADGILTEDGLRSVRSLVERLEAVPNIDLDRITSLVSRSAIAGGVEGLEV